MNVMTRIYRVVHTPKKFRFMKDEGSLGADQLKLFLEINQAELDRLVDRNGLVETQGFKFLDIGYVDEKGYLIDDTDKRKRKD